MLAASSEIDISETARMGRRSLEIIPKNKAKIILLNWKYSSWVALISEEG
jgi:hypothetical protein